MKAVRIHSFGGPEVLEVEDVAPPQPADGEVVIRVRAASVNPVDYKIRSGGYRGGKTELPVTLGRDVAGIVESVGPGVDGTHVGDEVYAFLGSHSGGYAELAVAKASETAPKPGSLDHVHAAAVPLAATTAWQALFDHGHLKRGERVLIHGAGGGVGLFAVQFAKAHGATVHVTAAPEDVELLKRLGADAVIDYKRERFEDRVRDVDLVIDLVGGETQDRSWSVLKVGGRMVSTLQEPRKEKAAEKHAQTASFMAVPRREQLVEIGKMIEDGRVKVIVEKTFPLEEVRIAHDRIEKQHSRGKVVLEVKK